MLVLERGRPWPPQSFPRTPREFRQGWWAPGRGRYGLFELHHFTGLEALTASGLGGGSLIYANVQLRADPQLDPYYDRVEAQVRPTPYPYADTTPKTRALLDAAAAVGMPAQTPPLAVAFGSRPGEPLPPAPDVHGGVPRESCRLCGACDVGCRYGAKDTLDFTYLSAAQAAGARIRCLCEARRLEALPGGRWRVGYRQHVGGRAGAREALLDPSAEPEGEVEAGRVVLAAGTFGSTALLLRNRAALGPLSPRLGHGFSGNGDLLMFLRGADRMLDPATGPVITASVSGPDYVVQDAGAPAWSEWAWQLLSLRLGNARASAAMMPLLGVGRDVPGGRMELDGDRLRLTWRANASKAYYEGLEDGARRLGDALGARVRRPGGRFARIVTVHPLGGCAIGASRDSGVVDELGRVFGAEGLHVADGSILPGPVGVNPSMTIAAHAERIAEGLAA